jgi:hypothetical protein
MKLQPNTAFQFTTPNSPHTYTAGVDETLVCIMHKEGDTCHIDFFLKHKEAQQHIDSGFWKIVQTKKEKEEMTLPKTFKFTTGLLRETSKELAVFTAEREPHGSIFYKITGEGGESKNWREDDVNALVDAGTWKMVEMPMLPQSFKFRRKNLPNFYFRASLVDSKTFGKAYKVGCYSGCGSLEEECYHSVESTEQFVEIGEWLIVDERAERKAYLKQCYKVVSYEDLDIISEIVKELLEEKNV